MKQQQTSDGERLLTAGEVAKKFYVDPKTVTRWAAAGKIGSFKTPGGHRRFRESEVRAYIQGDGAADIARPTPTGAHVEPDRSNRGFARMPSFPNMHGALAEQIAVAIETASQDHDGAYVDGMLHGAAIAREIGGA